MTRIWRIVAGVVAVLLAVYFVAVALKTLDLGALRQAVSSVEVLVALLVAAVLYALIIPITGWAWAVLLSSRAESWRPSMLIAILGLSQLAKYIPGNVAQHAARAAISLQRGMKPASLVATVAQETVLAIAASVAIGLLALLISGRGLGSLEPRHANTVVIASVVLLVAVMAFSISRGGGKAKSSDGPVARLMVALMTLPGWKATGTALSAYSLNYLLIGAGLWLVASALDGSGDLSYLTVTAAFSLSWLLGFMTPGAPAGLGTREGIMLMLLQGASNAETLVTFVLLARVVTMVGDVISFLGAAWLQRKVKRVGAD